MEQQISEIQIIQYIRQKIVNNVRIDQKLKALNHYFISKYQFSFMSKIIDQSQIKFYIAVHESKETIEHSNLLNPVSKLYNILKSEIDVIETTNYDIQSLTIRSYNTSYKSNLVSTLIEIIKQPTNLSTSEFICIQQLLNHCNSGIFNISKMDDKYDIDKFKIILEKIDALNSEI